MTTSNPYQFNIVEPRPWWGSPEDRDLHVMLVHPEIPGNTGNIGRLCAGANMWLHLVKPLGYELDNRYLKRAGLDYWPHVKLCVHDSLEEALKPFSRERLYLFTKKTPRRYTEAEFKPGSVLILGRETKGLDQETRGRFEDRCFSIPISEHVRSLNLSNACAVATYEAMRQLSWEPLDGK